MKKRLTDRVVQTIKPPAVGRMVYVDVGGPGLELRVSAEGRKTWSIRYRVRGGSRCRCTWGAYPAISLSAARARALEIAAAARHGKDLPGEEKRLREEAKLAASRPTTVNDLLSAYIERYCRNSQRRWAMTERLFDVHVRPKLGATVLPDLHRADIVELLDDLQNEKGLRAQVNRVRSQLIACFNWAIEREYLDANPAAAIKKRRIETSRDRVLSADELRAIWSAADALEEPSRSLVKVWILTGQRRDEVRAMEWRETDLKAGLWILPAVRNKAKRDHEVPLSSHALAILSTLPRLGRFVFSVNAERPYSGQKRLKQILDSRSGVTGWTYHDLRRTCSTGLAALRITQDTIDRVLGHAAGALAETYNRHQYREEKRSALQAWANYVLYLVRSDEANIVALRPGA